jgi:predicted outer membrane repeat protein
MLQYTRLKRQYHHRVNANNLIKSVGKAVVLLSMMVQPIWAVSSFSVNTVSLSEDNMESGDYLIDFNTLTTEHTVHYCIAPDIVPEIQADLHYTLTLENGVWGKNLSASSLSIEGDGIEDISIFAGGSVEDNSVTFVLKKGTEPLPSNTCLILGATGDYALRIPQGILASTINITAALVDYNSSDEPVNLSSITTAFVEIQATQTTTEETLSSPFANPGTNCSTVSEIPLKECETLVALYNKTNGPKWNDSPDNKWNQTNTPCSWMGVECSGNHVYQIDRSGQNLTGVIPDLSALSNLTELLLYDNQLNDSIPELSNLVNLQLISLENNKFSGLLPKLSTLTELTTLTVQNNQLSGIIPILPSMLETVTLKYNAFTGIEATEFGNNKKILPWWTEAKDKQTIPPTGLTATVLSETQVRLVWTPIEYTADGGHYQVKYGTSSNGPYSTPGGTTAETGGKNASSHIVKGLNPGITYSFVVETVTRAHNEQQSALTSVQSAVADRICRVQKDLPEAECDALFALYNSTGGPDWDDSSTNKWTKNNKPCSWEGVECIENRVHKINRSDQKLIGVIPNLSILTKLKLLNLAQNKLNGSIPNLDHLTALEGIYLNNNQLSGAIPNLSTLTHLQKLVLNDNQLTGNIPNLVTSKNLMTLSLSNNKLSGAIPTELNSLTQLNDLFLSNNELDGVIPDLSDLTQLQSLHLSDNKLEGSIPDDLSTFTDLKNISLFNNKLTGPIPDLSALTKLSTLRLYNNKLSGTIPDLNINSLQTVDLAYNLFTGETENSATNKDSDWANTQTVSPTILPSTILSDTTKIQLNWTPIPYKDGDGHYEIKYSLSEGGLSYSISGGQTTDKKAASHTITGLAAGTAYYFVVKTITKAHDDQQNELTSLRTKEFSAKTSGCSNKITVTNAKDSGFGSLRDAIATVCDDDTITFDNDYTINLESELLIENSLSIDGSNKKVIVSGQERFRVFKVVSDINFSINNLTITRGKVADNGGGIENFGTIVVKNSTFIANNAGNSGGAISSTGTATISNSTFSDNSANSGGGVFIGDGTVTMINCTLFDNVAKTSDGMIKNASTLHLKNTIIASNNSNGNHCVNEGTIAENIKNLIKDGSCNASLKGEPLLASLAYNGGNTKTYALLNSPVNSPAIDAGDNATCKGSLNNLDQRGISRIQGSACDIGAYELEKNSDDTNDTKSVPVAPTNLVATAISQTQINLSWTDNSTDETGFKIERDGKLINTTGVDVKEYSDTEVTCGRSYNYVVKATNANGDSTDITTATTLVCPPPLPPSDLKASAASQTQINLSWTDNSNNETGFKIERDGKLINTTKVDIEEYSDTGLESELGLECGTIYNYVVKATNANGDSKTITLNATTFVCPPSDLKASTVSQTQIDLLWINNNTEETRFLIERNGNPITIEIDVEKYSDTEVTCGNSYNYAVKATNANGDSMDITTSATTLDCSLLPPSDLTTSAVSQTQINLSWTDNSPNETGFKIERDDILIHTTGVDVKNYIDTGLKCGTPYNYAVKATNANGDSAAIKISARTLVCLPPTDFSATAISKTQINLSWTDNSTDETGFKIERDDILIHTTGVDVKNYIDTGLKCGRPYNYAVKATNANGDSDAVKDKAITQACPRPIIKGEIRTQAGVYGSRISIDAPEYFTLIGHIQPIDSHIGKLADITMTYHWKSHDSTSKWLTVTVPIAKEVPLEKEIENTLFEGRLIGFAGIFKIDLGYQPKNGEYFFKEIVTLDIRPNRAPTHIELTGNTVTPQKNSPNSLIGTFRTKDADKGEIFRYGLTENSDRCFKIVGNELRLSLTLDSESGSEYPLTVRSADMTGAYTDQHFTIHLTNETELTYQVTNETEFTYQDILLVPKSVREKSVNNTIVGRLVTTDGQKNAYVYELFDDAQGRFWLDKDSLRVTENSQLDYETQSNHNITVRGRSVDSQVTIEKTFTIEVLNVIDVDIVSEVRDATGQLIEPPIRATEEIQLNIQLIPEIKHCGLEADIICIAFYLKNGELSTPYVFDGNIWHEWNDDYLIKVPRVKRLILQNSHNIPLFKGPLTDFAGGNFNIYMGYRLTETEAFFYQPESVNIEVY